MTYQVKVPLVIASDEAGAHVYLYQGQPVPSSIPADEVLRLADGGFIEELAAAEADEVAAAETDEVVAPDGAPSEEWSAKQLDAYADANGIDVKAAKNKAEKVAAIVAASA